MSNPQKRLQGYVVTTMSVDENLIITNSEAKFCHSLESANSYGSDFVWMHTSSADACDAFRKSGNMIGESVKGGKFHVKRIDAIVYPNLLDEKTDDFTVTMRIHRSWTVDVECPNATSSLEAIKNAHKHVDAIKDDLALLPEQDKVRVETINSVRKEK